MNFIRTRVLVLIVAVMGFSTSVVADSFSLSGHGIVKDPVKMSSAEAEKLYQKLRVAMIAGYRLSDDRSAKNYSKWVRFNKFPYLSSQHGGRYLSNFGNEKAKDYLSLQEGDKVPFGSILVKDSFIAMENGKHILGALFIMEKLSEEAHPDTADWRYAMILPDGSMLGDTTGENPRDMDFCHACHEAAADTDYLFLLPDSN